MLDILLNFTLNNFHKFISFLKSSSIFISNSTIRPYVEILAGIKCVDNQCTWEVFASLYILLHTLKRTMSLRTLSNYSIISLADIFILLEPFMLMNFNCGQNMDS